MALTRKLLKGMGLTDEQVDTIIEAHTDTVDGLKADLSKYKTEAEKLPNVQKELDALKEKGDDGWKDKHDKLKTEYDNYKKDVEAKETTSKKRSAVRELLKNAGVSEKRLDTVLKVYDLNGVELDKDGKIKDATERENSIKTEWADFIETSGTVGASTANPPANSGGRKTKEEIMKITDRAERRAEIAKNMDLFVKEN